MLSKFEQPTTSTQLKRYMEYAKYILEYAKERFSYGGLNRQDVANSLDENIYSKQIVVKTARSDIQDTNQANIQFFKMRSFMRERLIKNIGIFDGNATSTLYEIPLFNPKFFFFKGKEDEQTDSELRKRERKPKPVTGLPPLNVPDIPTKKPKKVKGVPTLDTTDHLTIVITSKGNKYNTAGTYFKLSNEYGHYDNVLFIGNGTQSLQLKEAKDKLIKKLRNSHYKHLTFVFNTHGSMTENGYVIDAERIRYQDLINLIQDVTEGKPKDLFHIGCYGQNILNLQHHFNVIVTLSGDKPSIIKSKFFPIGNSNALQLFSCYLESKVSCVNEYIVYTPREIRRVKLNKYGIPYFGKRPEEFTLARDFHRQCKIYFNDLLQLSSDKDSFILEESDENPQFKKA